MNENNLYDDRNFYRWLTKLDRSRRTAKTGDELRACYRAQLAFLRDEYERGAKNGLEDYRVAIMVLFDFVSAKLNAVADEETSCPRCGRGDKHCTWCGR